MTAPLDQITAVVLAGGLARRMGGIDKGLVEVLGRPMIEHVLNAVRPQCAQILINANRNHQQYAAYGYPIVKDTLEDYCGPLAGMAAAMQTCKTRWLMVVPCDSPFLPADLAERLYSSLMVNNAEIAVAHDGERLQPVFALLDCDLLESLLDFLERGERKIDRWYAEHKYSRADFSDCPDTFLNINRPEDIEKLAQQDDKHE